MADSWKLWTKNKRQFMLFGENHKMAASKQNKRPLVLLFDIGGVCVVSPFQAILDYERNRGIPEGWVNWSISQTNPNGSWQKIERGEIPMNDAFFREFKADLSDEKRWRIYYAKDLAKRKGQKESDAAEEAAYQVPPVPDIDAEWLYWEMMRISREMDAYMYPALKWLRKYADQNPGKLILGALSNTSIFPPDHPFSDPNTPEGKQNVEMKALFDVFVSSAHVGMRKPDEDIYKYAIQQLSAFAQSKGYGSGGIEPSDITFLDDIGTNLRTARILGMNTIKVRLGRTDLAVKALEKVTGLDLGSDRAKL